MAVKTISQAEPGARSRVFAGVKILADAVRITMGPRGRHVLLDNRSGAPTICKDGATIANAIDLTDAFQNMGAQMVKQVAADTAAEAGDGTTTATVLAEAIVREGLKALAAGIQPQALKRGIDRAVSSAVDALRRLAQPCDGTDVAHVGTVAANADPSIGRMLARAFASVGVRGVVTLEDGFGREDELRLVGGMELDRGYVSPHFASDASTRSTTLENCRVLLCNQRIGSVRELLPILDAVAEAGSSLLVIADEVESEALSTLVVNFMRGVLKVVAIRSPGFGEQRLPLLQDIATLTGGNVIGVATGRSPEKATLQDLGSADRVVVEADRTSVIGGRGDTRDIRARAAELEREAANESTDLARERLRSRAARLSGGTAIIRIGGTTEVEVKDRRARYEGALRATRSAMEEGIVPGGGTSLLRMQHALRDIEPMANDEEAGIAVLGYALEEPLRQLAENAERDGSVIVETVRNHEGAYGFNAATREYVDMVAAGIVDAAKVTRVALQNAAAVAGTLLTTDVFIAGAQTQRPGARKSQPGIPRGSFGNRGILRATRQFRQLLDSPLAARRGDHPPIRDDTRSRQPQLESVQQYSPSDRFINTSFVSTLSNEVIPRNRALAVGPLYRLRVDIGPYRKESLDVERQPFPENALPDDSEGHWLELVVASDELLDDVYHRWLYLPKHGGSWVCDCEPGGPHSCKEDQRDPFAWVPLRAACHLGEARLRLGLYHERNLLQSQLITVTIAETETEAEDASARTDYRITAGLSELPPLPARTLHILTNDNADHSHRLVINQEKDKSLSYSFTEDQVGTAMGVVRQTLVDIHIAVTAASLGSAGRKDNRYRADNSKGLAEFKEDLRNLAVKGRELWASLAGDRTLMHELAQRLARKSSIQVSRTSKSRLVFPWALVYDYPLETGAPAAHTFCEFVDDWYDLKAAKQPDGVIADECPHAGAHKLNTICPYGFWGLRHVIEQPPSMPPNRDLPVRIQARQGAQMVIGFSKDLDFTKHLLSLGEAVAGRLMLEGHNTRAAIKGALDLGKALEVLYFYCHGRHRATSGAVSAQTYLEVGDKEVLTSVDFATWNSQWSTDHWAETSPLVIINGCHTTDMTPGALTTFVDAFTNAYAAGVIGTETTIHEDVASEAAELLLGYFCGRDGTGLPIGEAIRRMRFRLLRKGNVMGLTYTAYCSASLELKGSSQRVRGESQ